MKMITQESIRKELVAAIKQSGLSQMQIAEKLGIKQPTVSEYVTGKSMPALDTFANLCRVLDLDANEILCLK